MSAKPEGPLRRGWTTGACATAACAAACAALLGGRFPDPVTILLPRGQRPAFPLARAEQGVGFARAGVVKDAGDDPDVTHGALVIATVRAGKPGAGVTFTAGEGVGTVTRPGLPLAVGEPAINPVPRRMMREVVEALAGEHGVAADITVEIAVPGGEALAARTWNPRLGIVGGISILGTTGVVIPYSCSAWIHSIHRGIDVARASGLEHVAGCTGSTSEQAVRRLHGLDEIAMIDMGDFVGGMLKYLRRHPVPRLTIGGGFAKLSKLARGHLDLHSRRAEVDLEWLASEAIALGAGGTVAARIAAAGTALGAREVAHAAGVELADPVAREACRHAQSQAGGEVVVDVAVFDRAGGLIARAGG